MKLLVVSLITALGCSAPAFAAPPAAPVDVSPAPAAQPDTAALSDALVDDAATPQERRALLLRCSGPPPRPAKLSETPRPLPASATAIKSEAKAD
jgi:hypothetical protein